MCLLVSSIEPCRKRTVWKIFDTERGYIGSLYRGAKYPLNKKITRDCAEKPLLGATLYHAIHVFSTKAAALKEIKTMGWSNAYIARLKVDPNDFLAAGPGGQAAYHAAVRVGKFIKITNKRGHMI